MAGQLYRPAETRKHGSWDGFHHTTPALAAVHRIYQHGLHFEFEAEREQRTSALAERRRVRELQRAAPSKDISAHRAASSVDAVALERAAWRKRRVADRTVAPRVHSKRWHCGPISDGTCQ
jgi:hypothetical protein